MNEQDMDGALSGLTSLAKASEPQSFVRLSQRIAECASADALGSFAAHLIKLLQAEIEPQTRDYLVNLKCFCAQRMTDLLLEENRGNEAEEMLREAIQLAASYAKRANNKCLICRNQAVLHGKMGKILKANNRVGEALGHYTLAIELLGSAKRLAPEDPSILRFLSLYLNRLGDCYSEVDMEEKAEEAYLNDVETLHTLRTIEPNNLAYTRDLAVSLTRLALLRSRMGKLKESRSLLQESALLMEEVIENSPDDKQILQDYDVIRGVLGQKAAFNNDSSHEEQGTLFAIATQGKLPPRETFYTPVDEMIEEAEESLGEIAAGKDA